MIPLLVFELVVLLFSVIIHEISHGYVAEMLGDPTARLEGRLTLNPLSHIDPVGSILLPILFFLSFHQAFGMAKPVPYNPRNLENPRTGAVKIALAGPLANLTIAVTFGILMRILHAQGIFSPIPFLGYVVAINLLLAVFNLVPIPPLDGSRVLFLILPPREWAYRTMQFLETYGLFLVLIFAFFVFQFFIPLIETLYSVIVGIPF